MHTECARAASPEREPTSPSRFNEVASHENLSASSADDAWKGSLEHSSFYDSENEVLEHSDAEDLYILETDYRQSSLSGSLDDVICGPMEHLSLYDSGSDISTITDADSTAIIRDQGEEGTDISPKQYAQSKRSRTTKKFQDAQMTEIKHELHQLRQQLAAIKAKADSYRKRIIILEEEKRVISERLTAQVTNQGDEHRIWVSVQESIFKHLDSMLSQTLSNLKDATAKERIMEEAEYNYEVRMEQIHFRHEDIQNQGDDLLAHLCSDLQDRLIERIDFTTLPPSFCVKLHEKTRDESFFKLHPTVEESFRAIILEVICSDYALGKDTVKKQHSELHTFSHKKYMEIFEEVKFLKDPILPYPNWKEYFGATRVQPVKDTGQVKMIEAFKNSAYHQGNCKDILFATQVLNLCVDLYFCDTWMAVIRVAKSMFINTLTPKRLAKLLNGSSDLADFFMERVSNLLVQSKLRAAKKEGKLVEEKEKIENQGGFDTIRDFLRVGIRMEQKVADIPLLCFIDELISLLTFFYYDKEFLADSSFFKFIHERAFNKDVTTMGLITRVFETMDTAVMMTQTLVEGKDYTVFCDISHIPTRLSALKGLQKAYDNGNLDSIEGALNQGEFEREALQLSKDIKELMDKRAIHPRAMDTYVRYQSEVTSIAADVMVNIRSSQYKPMGTFVGIYGTPGCGKTSIMALVQRAIGQAFDTKIEEHQVWSAYQDPNGWHNGADSSKRFMRINEHLNIKVQDPACQIFASIAEMNDTVPSHFRSADAHGKGKRLNHMYGGAICCNVENFGAGDMWMSVDATTRRVVFIRVEVKEEYAKKDLAGNLVPDPRKIPNDANGEPIVDIHRITRYWIRSSAIKGDKAGKSSKIDLEDICVMEVSEFVTWLYKHARKNRFDSIRYNEMNMRRKDAITCRHCANVEVLCKCRKGFKPFDPDGLLDAKNDDSLISRQLTSLKAWIAKKRPPPVQEENAVDREGLLKRAMESTACVNQGDETDLPYDFVDVLMKRSQCWSFTMGTGLFNFFIGMFGSTASIFLESTVCKYLNVGTLTSSAIGLMFLNPILGVFWFTSGMFAISFSKTWSKFLVDAMVTRSIKRNKAFRYWSSSLGNVVSLGLVVAGVCAGIYATSRSKRESEEIQEIPDPVPVSEPEITIDNNGDLNPFSLADVMDRRREPDQWLEPIRSDIEDIHPKLNTMTTEQVQRVVRKQLVLMTSSENIARKLLFIRSNAALSMNHTGEFRKGQSVTIHFEPGTTLNVRHTFILEIYRLKIEGSLCDAVVYIFDMDLMMKNITHLFAPKIRKNPGTVSFAGSNTQVLKPVYGVAKSEKYTFPGYTCELNVDTQAGDCSVPIVSTSHPPEILGLHVSLSKVSNGKSYSNIIPITSSALEATLKLASVEVREWVREQQGFSNVPGELSPIINQGEPPHENSCVRYLRNRGEECTPKEPSIEYLGSNKDRRRKYYSTVFETPFSKHLTKAGWPTKHGIPKLNANKAASATLQFGARGMLDMPPIVLRAIEDDFISKVVHRARQLGMVVRMLSEMEAMNGIKEDKWFKRMKTTTAAGGGLAGKKHRYIRPAYMFDYDEFDRCFPLEDEEATLRQAEFDNLSVLTDDSDSLDWSLQIDFDRQTVEHDVELVPLFKRWVRMGLRELAAGNSWNGVSSSALKDEATKIEKLCKAARIMASQSLPHHVIDVMIFSSVQAVLKSIPFTSRCFEGVCSVTDEWSQIFEWFDAISTEPNYLEGDMKKMDMSLSGQLMRSNGRIQAGIARGLGATETHCTMIEARIADLCSGIWDYQGDFVRMEANTSGNRMTVTTNNIAGVQLPHRYAYVCLNYAKKHGLKSIPSLETMSRVGYDEALELVVNFDNEVRIGSVGDDSIGKTSRADFNMRWIRDCYAQLAATYTDARKSENIMPFQTRQDLSFCKRRWRWNEFHKAYVSCLEIDAIGKSLHWRMPSQLSNEDHFIACIRNACEELSRHDPTVFTDYVGRLIAAAKAADSYQLVSDILETTQHEWEQIHAKNYRTGTEKPELRPASVQAGLANRQEGRVAHMEFMIPAEGYSQPEVRLNSNESRSEEQIDPSVSFSITRISNQGETNQTTHVQENIEMLDDTSHEVVDANTDSFPLMHLGTTNDTNESILNRPVRILNIAWNVGEAFHEVFDPWSLLMQNRTISNRLNRFRHFSGTLHIKIMVNGTNFHHGLVWAVYLPLDAVDEHNQLRASSKADLVEASQRLHAEVKARDSEGAIIECPFIYHKNSVDLVTGEQDQLGRMVITVVNPLRMANGGTQNATLTVLAYFKDVQLNTPTAHDMSTLVTQIDNQGESFISGPLDAVANMTGKMSKLPVIGKAAESASKVAGSLGAMASLFGFSRPTDQSVSAHKLVTSTRLAVTSGNTFAKPLSMHPAKAINMDQRCTWGSDKDEMVIPEIAQKESYISTFVWNSQDPIDKPLFSIRCTPFQAIADVNADDVSEYHVTPSTWIGLPFTYWTGSSVFRFQVVSAQAHVGRLRFVWDPVYPKNPGEWNLNYSSIVDIGTQQDATINCGWGQNTNYLPCVSSLSEAAESYTPDAFTSEVPHANGVLSVYVVSPLMVPNDDTSQIVEINVYSKMGSDVEFAVPRDLVAQSISPQVDNVPVVVTVVPPLEDLPRVINPTTDTIGRTVAVQQVPMYYLFTPQQRIGTSNDFDITYFQFDSQPNRDLVVVSNQTGFSPHKQFVVSSFNMSIEMRGFVEGATQGTWVVNSDAPARSFPEGFSLSGISDNIDVVFGDDSVSWRGASLTLGTNNRVYLGEITYPLPPLVGPIVSPVTPEFLSITGGRSVFKIKRPPGQYYGNWVLRYKLPDQFEPMIIRSSATIESFVLPTTGNNGSRIISLDVGTETEFTLITDTNSVSFLEQSWFIRDAAALRSAIKNQGDESSFYQYSENSLKVVNQGDESSVHFFGPPAPGMVNQVYFGEQVMSIRQVLKRYTTRSVLTSTTAGDVVRAILPHFPFQYRNEVPTQLNATLETQEHLLEYFSKAYLAIRGSMRMIILSQPRFGNPGHAYMSVKRTTYVQTLPTDAARSTPYGFSGGEYEYTRAVGALEVELPWYNQYRFGYARSTASANHTRDWYILETSRVTLDAMAINYAIGEDFGLTHFQCTPILVENG